MAKPADPPSRTNLRDFPHLSDNVLVAPFAVEAASLETAQEGEEKLGPREFRGLAAVYGNVFERWSWKDWGVVPTVLEPGAFGASVAEINGRGGDRAGKVPLLWEHYQLLGRSLSLTDETEGLRTHCRVTDQADAVQRYAHIKDGSADGMSVGFNIIRSVINHDEQTDRDVEHIQEAQLKEVTACLWGANPLALIEAAASVSMVQVPPELLAGAVLSAKNKKLVSSAVEALNALLAAAEKDDDEDDDGNASAASPIEALRTETRAWFDLMEARLDAIDAHLGRKE